MEIKMTAIEREIAVKGIRKAIENGKKEEKAAKENRGLLILIVVAMLYNVVTLEAGNPIATVCGIAFATVMCIFVLLLKIF